MTIHKADIAARPTMPVKSRQIDPARFIPDRIRLKDHHGLRIDLVQFETVKIPIERITVEDSLRRGRTTEDLLV